MADELFRSAWLKCVWAIAQSYQFEGELEAALKEAETNPPFTTRQEYHPEFHGFSVKVAAVCEVPPRWGLMLGDLASGFHDALDHLAWALVSRGRTPPPRLTERQRRGIYFPICSTNAIFNRKLGGYLPGARRADIAMVRKAQPYFSGKITVSRHCLTTLQELSDADKHRTVQLVLLRPDRSIDEFQEARDCVIRRIREMRPRALKVDAEISRVYAKKTGPNPDIALKGYLATSVAFGNGAWVANFLKTIREFVPVLLAQFAEPDIDIKALLAPGKLLL
ncbi:MAG: hypothetical protein ABSE52_07565 [Candidatus Dormibacteria bacterium]|jgi:hypothetical protein